MSEDAEVTNEVAKAILAGDTRPSHFWSFYWGGGYKTAREHLSSHSFPRNEAAVKLIKELTGVALAVNHREAKSDYQLLNEWVRIQVARLTPMTRAEFLAREHKILRTGGMGQQVIKAELGVMFAPVAGGYQGPRTLNHYYGLRVRWFGDGSMLIDHEDALADGSDTTGLYLFAGCDHEFEHRSGGNCYHIYTCKKCKHRYDIDSGD